MAKPHPTDSFASRFTGQPKGEISNFGVCRQIISLGRVSVTFVDKEAWWKLNGHSAKFQELKITLQT